MNRPTAVTSTDRLAIHFPSVSELVDRTFRPLLRVYVYFAVLLPSGSIFGINVKTICFALLFPSALQRFLQAKRAGLLHIGLLLALPAAFLLWVLISQIYGYDMTLALGQYKEILVTMASCWLAAVACDDSDVSRVSLLRTILHAEVAACVLKLLLLAYSYHQGLPITVVVDAISTAFGVQLMGLDFESALGRIQFVADGLIPLCFYLLLRHRKRLRISTLSALGMFLMLTFSLVLTFSRYFWIFAAITFALGLIFGKKDRFYAMVLVLLSIVTAASLPFLIDVYQLRFSMQVAGGSDNIRTRQIPPLVSFFRSAPFFGHGFGSHTEEVIRSRKVPYEYEVQIYALAGQEGLVGLSLMGFLLAVYFSPLWPLDRHNLAQKIGLILILLTWLAAGLVNPLLLSSAAAMSYAFIRTLAGLEVPDPGGALLPPISQPVPA